jgi:2-polyprenyl-6-methoxyphenol hydroxylase-like FAD-dependent oxidoreductase
VNCRATCGTTVGANTALRDADLLRRALTAVDRGSRDLVPAVRDYEDRMRDYGFAAVAQSLRNAKMGASGSRPARFAFRTALRTVNALSPLKRKFATGLGT